MKILTKKQIQWTIFIIWSLIATGTLGFFHGWHNIVFPEQKTVTKELLPKVDGLGITHFLGAGCSCSQHILDYLIKRKRSPKYQETIVLIGNFEEREKLVAAGYHIIDKKIDDIQGELTGVPLFVVYDHNQIIQYAGAYSKAMITPLTIFQDLKIAGELGMKRKVASLPIRGCSVSKKYQALLDPLGLKYAQKE